MICPKCKSVDSKIVDTRKVANGLSVRRRHECLKCGFRFTTYEILPWDFSRLSKELRWE